MHQWRTFHRGKKLVGFEPLGDKWYLVHPSAVIITVERKAGGYQVKSLTPRGEDFERVVVGTTPLIGSAKALAEEQYQALRGTVAAL